MISYVDLRVEIIGSVDTLELTSSKDHHHPWISCEGPGKHEVLRRHLDILHVCTNEENGGNGGIPSGSVGEGG